MFPQKPWPPALHFFRPKNPIRGGSRSSASTCWVWAWTASARPPSTATWRGAPAPRWWSSSEDRGDGGDGGDGLGGGEVTKKVGEDFGVWGKIQCFLGFGRYFLRIEDGSVETLHGEVMLMLWGWTCWKAMMKMGIFATSTSDEHV